MHHSLVLGFLVAIGGLGVLADDGITITSCYSKGSNCDVKKNLTPELCYAIENPEKRGDKGSFFGVSSHSRCHDMLS